jgi:hypothetical protein
MEMQMAKIEFDFKVRELELRERELQMEFDMAGAEAAREERTALIENRMNLDASAQQHAQKLQQTKEAAKLKKANGAVH